MTCTGWTWTSEGKIRVEQIVQGVEEDESVQAAMTGPNSKSNKRHRVNSVIDKHVLAQVNDSIGLYQKLTDEKTNEAFKRNLFAHLLHRFSEEEAGRGDFR